MSKVNYIEIRDKKTGKVTTVELGGAGGAGTTIITKNAIMETDDSGDVATGMALVDGFTYEELTALLNDRNSKVVLDLSEGRGYQCYVLDQLLFMNQLADNNFAQVVYKCNDYLFANKIIILAITYQDGEMNYQIALLDANSAGGDTNDTAYVEDEVLYIEEGTTASGGSGITYLNIKDLTEVPEEYRDVEKLKNCFLTTGGMIYTPDNVMSYGDNWEIFFSSLYEGTYWWVGIDETGKIRSGYSNLLTESSLNSKISVKTNSDGTVDLIIN